MRTIKFRSYDTGMNRMDYFNLGDTVPYFYNQLDVPVQYEVMQFIGIEDMNGKEVFEGDIITNGYVVVFMEDCAYFTTEKDGYFGKYIFNKNGKIISGKEFISFEVLGNIYENPELLQ